MASSALPQQVKALFKRTVIQASTMARYCTARRRRY
nr:hypothetical protein [Planococcus faecalis]